MNSTAVNVVYYFIWHVVSVLLTIELVEGLYTASLQRFAKLNDPSVFNWYGIFTCTSVPAAILLEK